MNAKAAEFAALVRDRFPDPPPHRVVFGVSGTEFANVSEFQYASRFLWNGAELRDYPSRVRPRAELRRQHVENWLGGVLRARVVCLRRARCAAGRDDGSRARCARDRRSARSARHAPPGRGRYNQADVLSPDGTSDDGLPQSSLAELLAAGNDVRIPPYSLGDASELVEGRDFPLMRSVLGEFRARGREGRDRGGTPPSPWLQEKGPAIPWRAVPPAHGGVRAPRSTCLSCRCRRPRPFSPTRSTWTPTTLDRIGRAALQAASCCKRLGDSGYFDD